MTHAEIAAHCLEPVQRGHSAKLIAEAHERICKALSNQRREQLQAQADMLCDATPHRAKGTTA